MLRDPVMQFISQFHSRRTNVEEAKRQMIMKEREKPGEGLINKVTFLHRVVISKLLM